MKLFRIFSDLTLYSTTWLFLGLLLTTVGVYAGYKWRMYVLSLGLLAMSFGLVSFGLTRGFTDYSPEGRLLSKMGIIALLLSLPPVIYSIFRML